MTSALDSYGFLDDQDDEDSDSDDEGEDWVRPHTHTLIHLVPWLSISNLVLKLSYF